MLSLGEIGPGVEPGIADEQGPAEAHLAEVVLDPLHGGHVSRVARENPGAYRHAVAGHGQRDDQEVFWRSVDLFKLDVDLVLYDATTAWFECDEEDVTPESWRGPLLKINDASVCRMR